tara:strand:- start:827 stop:2053 length:1227 start_codon:yes stop_codon:yes gene_type:complete
MPFDIEMEEFYETNESKEKYFGKFKNMKPYFEINEKEWTYIKETFSEEEIRESLVKILMKYEPPYMDITEKECLRDYQKLKGVKWNDLFIEKEWFARSEYDWERSNNLIKRLNVGNKSSNYFQQKNRWSVDGTVSPGPLRTWENEKFMYTLLGSLFSLKAPKVNKSILRTSISLRKYICSQFKPNVAKAIYDRYKCKNVLDFSAGWGDRLAGFYASDYTEFYLGIDPRKENHPIYEKQAEFYQKHSTFFETEKRHKFICSPAEDADLSEYEGMMDIVFTSPPYFNVERYSHDDTQSWVRYKNIDNWNKNFLQKSINNVWKTLRKGGMLMVNISDVNASSGGKKEWLKICDPMNDYIKTFDDSEYVECFGMEMAKRPNSIGVGTALNDENNNEKESDTFGEPVWVWKKI